jgi:hypothetical protein
VLELLMNVTLSSAEALALLYPIEAHRPAYTYKEAGIQVKGLRAPLSSVLFGFLFVVFCSVLFCSVYVFCSYLLFALPDCSSFLLLTSFLPSLLLFRFYSTRRPASSPSPLLHRSGLSRLDLLLSQKRDDVEVGLALHDRSGRTRQDGQSWSVCLPLCSCSAFRVLLSSYLSLFSFSSRSHLVLTLLCSLLLLYLLDRYQPERRCLRRQHEHLTRKRVSFLFFLLPPSSSYFFPVFLLSPFLLFLSVTSLLFSVSLWIDGKVFSLSSVRFTIPSNPKDNTWHVVSAPPSSSSSSSSSTTTATPTPTGDSHIVLNLTFRPIDSREERLNLAVLVSDFVQGPFPFFLCRFVSLSVVLFIVCVCVCVVISAWIFLGNDHGTDSQGQSHSSPPSSSFFFLLLPSCSFLFFRSSLLCFFFVLFIIRALTNMSFNRLTVSWKIISLGGNTRNRYSTTAKNEPRKQRLERKREEEKKETEEARERA